MLALLTTTISLTTVMMSASVAAGWNDELALTPSTEEVEAAASLHVLAFSSRGDLLIAESEGSFDYKIWERMFELAEHACQHDEKANSTLHGNLEHQLRAVIQDRVAQEQKWKRSDR